jgi:serine/threonine protein kinase
LLAREVEKLRHLFTDRYVVQLFEVGWDSDPPYYVMEYMENGSLEERLRRGPLPVIEAVALFREVAVGLVHAHGKGILHCDLKPANVLLDQDLKPRLADFGQARMSREPSPALGTLFFMAPEQANLEALPDARWDVYALGALLHTMLTGQPPYRTMAGAAEVMKAGRLEERLKLYRRFLHEAPRPSAHRQVPDVDPALADIVDRCLDLNLRSRFPNAQTVLNALNDRANRLARRPLLILGTFGPALAVLIMAIFATWLFFLTVKAAEREVLDRALESNQFAARTVAERWALEIDRRWTVLEKEAQNPKLRQWLILRNKLTDSQEEKALNAWIKERHEYWNNYFQRGEGQNPKSEVRNPKSETQNPKSEIRNPKPETRNPKPETRNPKPETRNPKSEIRNPKSETRNPKSEIRNPKPEIRNPKSETRNPKSREEVGFPLVCPRPGRFSAGPESSR